MATKMKVGTQNEGVKSIEYETSANMHKLGRILECPVCLEVPTSTPIYRCDNGHILCKECRNKLTTCPECRIRLGNKRCLTSEKIVREIPLKTMPLNGRSDTHGCYPNYQEVEGNYVSHEDSKDSCVSWWDIGKYVAVAGFSVAAGVAAASFVTGHKNDKSKTNGAKGEDEDDSS